MKKFDIILLTINIKNKSYERKIKRGTTTYL